MSTERSKIGITAKFHRKILYYGHAKFVDVIYYCNGTR